MYMCMHMCLSAFLTWPHPTCPAHSYSSLLFFQFYSSNIRSLPFPNQGQHILVYTGILIYWIPSTCAVVLDLHNSVQTPHSQKCPLILLSVVTCSFLHAVLLLNIYFLCCLNDYGLYCNINPNH